MFFAYLTSFFVALLPFTSSAGVGKAWEVSPVQHSDHLAPLSSWPRTETSPFEIRSISGIGRLAQHDRHEPFSSIKRNADKNKAIHTSTNDKHHSKEDVLAKSMSQSRQSRELEDFEDTSSFVPENIYHDPIVEGFFRKMKDIEDVEAVPSFWENVRNLRRTERNHGDCSESEEIDESYTPEKSEWKPLQERPRVRREVEAQMEKIATSKNVREGRLSSPESWSTQPLSVEFRHRTNLDKVTDVPEKLARSTSRGLKAPHAEFVTANRRSFSENRGSRDLPLAASSRSFEDTLTYRNTLRDRDLDAPYSRGLFYPERYRTERDYFVNKGPNEPTYPRDYYRQVDFDLYDTSKSPITKPKRIIYYATLPEIVRKPVDLRNYPRPSTHGSNTRLSTNVMSQDGYYNRRGGSVDPGRYQYYSRPYGSNYDNYNMYPKNWYDRSYAVHTDRIDDARGRIREQDMERANMRDASRNEEATLEFGQDGKMLDRARFRDHEKMLWPVKIGTDVGLKENEKFSGGKNFAQHDVDYSRFRENGRMDRNREETEPAESRD